MLTASSRIWTLVACRLSPSLSLSLSLSHIYIYIYKLATVVEGDQKAIFSIATTPRYWGGRWIAPLYPWYVPAYVLSVKQGGIFKVFGMTRPEIEPRSPGPLGNTLPTGPISRLSVSLSLSLSLSIYIYIYKARWVIDLHQKRLLYIYIYSQAYTYVYIYIYVYIYT